MNPDSTRKRRNLTLVAVGVALLVLTGWLVTAWVSQGHATESNLTTAAAGTMKSGDASESSAPPTSRRREAQGSDEQIRSRVESMLNIRSNEVAIITLPKAALDQCLGQSVEPSMPNVLSMMRGLVTKDVLKRCLEGVLKEGGPVKAKIGDQGITEYSGSQFQMTVEVSNTSKGEAIVLVRAKVDGSDLITQLSIVPGFGLVYQLSTSSEEGVVILVGEAPGPATGTTNP